MSKYTAKNYEGQVSTLGPILEVARLYEWSSSAWYHYDTYCDVYLPMPHNPVRLVVPNRVILGEVTIAQQLQSSGGRWCCTLHFYQLEIPGLQACLSEGVDDGTTYILACYCQMAGSEAYGGVSQISVRGEKSVVNKYDRSCGDLRSVSHISRS
jgi:hypothetical protein